MAASLDRLQSLWRKGDISLDTLVWTEGMEKRARLRDISVLRARLESSTASHLPSPPGKPHPAWAEVHLKLRGDAGSDGHEHEAAESRLQGAATSRGRGDGWDGETPVREAVHNAGDDDPGTLGVLVGTPDVGAVRSDDSWELGGSRQRAAAAAAATGKSSPALVLTLLRELKMAQEKVREQQGIVDAALQRQGREDATPEVAAQRQRRLGIRPSTSRQRRAGYDAVSAALDVASGRRRDAESQTDDVVEAAVMTAPEEWTRGDRAVAVREAASEEALAEARDLVLVLRALVVEEKHENGEGHGCDVGGPAREVRRLLAENDALRRQLTLVTRQAAAAKRAAAALADVVAEESGAPHRDRVSPGVDGKSGEGLSSITSAEVALTESTLVSHQATPVPPIMLTTDHHPPLTVPVTVQQFTQDDVNCHRQVPPVVYPAQPGVQHSPYPLAPPAVYQVPVLLHPRKSQSTPAVGSYSYTSSGSGVGSAPPFRRAQQQRISEDRISRVDAMVDDLVARFDAAGVRLPLSRLAGSRGAGQYLLNGRKLTLMARADKLLMRVGGGSEDFLDWLGRNRALWEGSGARPSSPWRT